MTIYPPLIAILGFFPEQERGATFSQLPICLDFMRL
jgi:hypothetical protein